MRWLRYGADGWLLDCASLNEVAAVRASIAAAGIDGLTELVPAARTVLVAGTNEALSKVREVLANTDLSQPPTPNHRTIVLDVHYDGADLALVAETAGMSTESVIAAHTGAVYTVAFTGFAPGFGYLTGLPPALQQSRLDSPRTRVPVGAVGVAGEFTGVYPRSSPGGWRLLGHTEATLFDPSSAEPVLLAPGDQVRFRSV